MTAATARRRSARSPCEFGNTAHNPTTRRSPATTSCSARARCSRPIKRVIGAEPEAFDSARDDERPRHPHRHHRRRRRRRPREHLRQAARLGSAGIAPRARIVAYKGLRRDGWLHLRPRRGDRPGGRRRRRRHQLLDRWRRRACRRRRHRVPVRRRRRRLRRHLGRQRRSRRRRPSAPARCPWVTAVGASTHSRVLRGHRHARQRHELTRCVASRSALGHAPLVDAAERRQRAVPTPASSTRRKVEGKIVLCLRGAIGRVEKSLAVFDAGGVGMILYNTDRRRRPVHRQPLGPVGPRRQHAGPRRSGLHRRRPVDRDAPSLTAGASADDRRGADR